MQIIETIQLNDVTGLSNRVLTVYRCKNQNCGCLKAQIMYYDTTKGQFIYETIRSKNVAEVINRYKNEPYLKNAHNPIKHGSKANMSWKYHRNGGIYDFNNTLIERINKK